MGKCNDNENQNLIGNGKHLIGAKFDAFEGTTDLVYIGSVDHIYYEFKHFKFCPKCGLKNEDMKT